MPVVAAALIPRLDLFISLIGALASSCLAIIFPAIIQMCTFWRYGGDGCEGDEDGDENDGGYNSGHTSYQEGVSPGGTEVEAASSSSSPQRQQQQQQLNQQHRERERQPRRNERSTKKRVFWSLFICKNLLLIVFGILGLITGSWISISQLSSAYLGLESAS